MWWSLSGGFPSHRLEPLLARIQEDRTAVLCPEIDLIDKNTLQYGGTGSFSVGGFWWSLHFSWRPIPPHEQQRRASAISPIRYTRTHCALSDLYVLTMHLVNFCTKHLVNLWLETHILTTHLMNLQPGIDILTVLLHEPTAYNILTVYIHVVNLWLTMY